MNELKELSDNALNIKNNFFIYNKIEKYVYF